MGFRQIQAPTLRELFVDQVIGMIFSGELKVGDRLPSERELSEQMHISRSMVHTGLEDLERMGFVRMEARRGNYIEDYARHGNFETLMALAKYGGEFDHAIESSLVEARDAIEGGAMLLLGERGTPEDMQQLRAITDGLRAAVDAGEGNAVYAQWMRRFDTTIAELSGNRIFPMLMNSLADVGGIPGSGVSASGARRRSSSRSCASSICSRPGAAATRRCISRISTTITAMRTQMRDGIESAKVRLTACQADLSVCPKTS